MTILEEYWIDSILVKKKHFNKHTTAHGPDIEYYDNGKIRKWKWFDSTSQYPAIGIYYDSSGHYDCFRGNPFLGSWDHFDSIAVEMIKPPDIDIILGMREFKDDRLFRQRAYEPGIKDNKGWVTINKDFFNKDRAYYIYYYFMSDEGKIMDSAYIELVTSDFMK